MAVYFAPQYQDPNAEAKQYMMMMAQMLGAKRSRDTEQKQMSDFAQSIQPSQTPTIDGQSFFSPEGRGLLSSLTDRETAPQIGSLQGPMPNPQQVLQRALQHGLPPEQAMKMAQGFAGLMPTPKQESYKYVDLWDKKGEYLGQKQIPVSRYEEQLAKYRKAGYKFSEPEMSDAQTLAKEGYTPEEIKRIMDIKHGIEPRAGAVKDYNNMSTPDKAKYLATERTKAEGHYFAALTAEAKAAGTKPPEPRQPEYLEWILKEQAKVNKALKGTGIAENPYKTDYPDAFMEVDNRSNSPTFGQEVWKVIRDGKTYIIEGD